MTTTNGLPAVLAQAERQEQLEDLYRADGREDPEHPLHGLYTGLEAADRMARWRENCLATPPPIDYGWRPCMMRRAKAHLLEENPEIALRELDALCILLGALP
jgi:hypothetical protein